MINRGFSPSRFGLFLVLVLLLGVSLLPASAQVPEDERVLITDPATLESMGFAPDSTNVYMAKALQSGASAPAEADDFGGNVHFSSISAKSFQGRLNTGATVWEHAGGAHCCSDISRAGTENFADAQFRDLPTGAAIGAFRWWANDTNAAANLAIFVFEVCNPGFGPGFSVTTIASSSPATAGATGDQSGVLAGNLAAVNNQDCVYVARVRFDAADPTLSFQKIRAQWSRAVSAAPAVATFSDVPTGHPFFRFVEALADAGITGGCGVGLFCPNDPLTRGQMAVFLSVALGLNFQ